MSTRPPCCTDHGRTPPLIAHWALLVGDFYHELVRVSVRPPGRNSGNARYIAYRNGPRSELTNIWTYHPTGRPTGWNDAAIADGARSVIRGMRAEYHVLDNNCQHFVRNLSSLILGPQPPRRFYGAAGLFSMPLPALSQDEWIEDAARAEEEPSLCTVQDEDSDAVKEIKTFMDDVMAKLEVSEVNPVLLSRFSNEHSPPFARSAPSKTVTMTWGSVLHKSIEVNDTEKRRKAKSRDSSHISTRAIGEVNTKPNQKKDSQNAAAFPLLNEHLLPTTQNLRPLTIDRRQQASRLVAPHGKQAAVDNPCDPKETLIWTRERRRRSHEPDVVQKCGGCFRSQCSNTLIYRPGHRKTPM
ncbi:uncharacterized protein LACBIDRAFT_329320 [Laccaria bicolor S238N-H82]|uniref:Predicted protein n=1 Tax=Laccaria bicolor (strain S238N-H82 / ATCC MYA-4686) TaxID=486041 RepID=B0DHN7_LACBS|nr:uncharacterized protein LACBIDRAFT_329320 [Laccaria bicolor S238N-H82]EDR05866.1 predicted protein [Laccaria bicolor S238N-H82]|eukprot:XP_001883542.1 predicted protein [Laccaria bicolor S238N-H82]